MTNGNEPINIIYDQPNVDNKHRGLTKLEYFAATATIIPDDISFALCEAVNGCKAPSFQHDPIASLEWWANGEARLRILKAKALINELNK